MAEATPQPEDRTQTGQFAVTNVAELLERMAYYGVLSVNALYLDSIGHSATTIGLLSAVLLPLPYLVPLLAGALSEKVGYRPMMLAALAFYAAGFTALAASPSFAGILAGIVLVGVGAGAFKPVTAATIAHVTSERHRSLGYTIYYTGINVGAFLGPLLIAGVIHAYRQAFLVGAAIIGATFALTLAAYRNPQPPQRGTDVWAALRRLGAVAEDRRLLVLLAVFSGFWFLYSMNFTFVALYLDRYVALPSWFPANLQQSINPAVIILLGVPIGAAATRAEPRRMMTLGVLLYVVGFAVLGFAPNFPLFVAGLVIATIGEILAYPAFLAHLSRLAPKDRVAVYQSYGFLPLFVGFFLGPLACGPLFQALALDGHRPALFWAIPTAVGLLTLAAFLATAAPAPEGAAARPRRARTALVLLLVPVLLAAGALAGPRTPLDSAPGDGGAAGLATFQLPERSGTASEGETHAEPFEVPDGAAGNLTFTLTWSDDGPPGTLPGTVNRPDAFRLGVKGPGGRLLAEGSAENPAGGRGAVTLAIPAAGLAGPLAVEVTLDAAGDVFLGPAMLAEDTSNAWRLAASHQAAAPAASAGS